MAQPVTVRVEQDVPTRMRDGTVLYSDLYRPDTPGRYPVILCRTPYNKDAFATRVDSLDPIRAAREGYAFIMQNVRGRYNSEGAFYTFKNEINDGYDTVEWAATQPWSTGAVGMHGGSYVGATQWLAAISKPPHLKCIIPSITSDDYYEGWTYQGGAFQLFFTMSWSLSLATGNLEHIERDHGDVGKDASAMAEAQVDMESALEHLGFADHPLYKNPALAQYFNDWVHHESDDSYWRAVNIRDRHSEIDVPAYNMGGWFDIFLGGTIRNYLGMRQNGATEAARSGQRLIIGPWFHDSSPGSVAGEVNFGPSADSTSFDFQGSKLRWFDYWLKGEQNGLDAEDPVRIFVMGANEWRSEKEWPLARTRFTDYYLHSGGKANSARGDGTLSVAAPGDEPNDAYLYNPNNPVPTRGGGLCCDSASSPPGSFDQGAIEAREDVLVYSTEPLENPVEVTGPVTLTLYAASSAVDTDFTAKLVDACPCGGAVNLADGIIRARYRESTSEAKPITPGEVYEYKIDLWATSNLFKAGHRIRLEVSSSNFPRFDRNPNTGAPLGTASAGVPASQTVLHNQSHPSRLTLPVIPA